MKQQLDAVKAFPFYCIRNVSCPHDEKVGRRVYAGHAPATSFLDLSDNDNVREDRVEATGKKQKRTDYVHRKMRETLNERPEDFSILNGGVVILAKQVSVDDQKKLVMLAGESIINGSQTRGELRRYLRGKNPHEVFVFFQLVETEDEDLAADISIARNTQIQVETISIMGRKDMLRDLDPLMQQLPGGKRLRTKETDRGEEEFYDTEKLIQVLLALTPDELWPVATESGVPNKTITYNAKTKCLRLFGDVFDDVVGNVERKKPNHRPDVNKQALYQFFLDITPAAWQIYQEWKKHKDWVGTNLHFDKTNAPDGIVFPVLSALASFMKRVDGKWQLRYDNTFLDPVLISAAKSAWMDIAKSNPQTMGKSRPCYRQLRDLAEMAKLSQQHYQEGGSRSLV